MCVEPKSDRGRNTMAFDFGGGDSPPPFLFPPSQQLGDPQQPSSEVVTRGFHVGLGARVGTRPGVVPVPRLPTGGWVIIFLPITNKSPQSQ